MDTVVNEIQQNCIQQLESFRQAINSVSNDLNQPYTESENRIDNWSYSDQFDGANFDKLDERLRSMESVLQQILIVQQELQSTLSFFMSEMHRFIQYSHSLQLAKTPKRPYVTTDVGVFYRMKAALNAGTTVRLHLMCEYEYGSGIHMVKDQEGLMIHMDWENCEWIRKTIEISCKVMYYAVKAGLDKTLNLGQAIPDSEDFKSDIVELNFCNRDRRAVLKAWLSSANSLSKAVHSEGIDIKAVVEEIDKFLDVLTLRSGDRLPIPRNMLRIILSRVLAIYTEAGPDKLSKMSTRDGSPYTRRKEERREREGDMNDDRLGREADVGDRYRDNNRQSESNYDRNDKSRKSEIERKSTREYDRDYRSSIYHEIGDYKQREAFGREERHSRSLSEHDRTYERDDRPRKDYDVDDRHKRRLN
ncbi:hypothetical protein AXG93_392s1530 [Marchantia polymorpha subsp. ruderalis]|uniref:Uncharacterized protein n=1 Tax=Marchantia polymorpha subsp. ruderalis TaxID=1480154 RepID=A0A176WR46_MARPO|nr:hypothetical protein AXG93_392s1530 [Marchantia polymorpha subsp. ruderalis]